MVDDMIVSQLLPLAQIAPPRRTKRTRLREAIETLPLEKNVTRKRLEELAHSLVDDDSHLAWTMVLIGSHFWRDRVRAIPHEKRLLLLPHCMRNTARCPAAFTADGLLCENCGKCELGTLKSEAETLGYHVMIAEGSPIVMQWILSGKVDAILGVGCLRSLEKAFEKLQMAGIPALAIPLHGATCQDSTTDIDWVREMIQTPFVPTQKIDACQHVAAEPPIWIHLLRAASQLFAPKTPRDPSPQNEVVLLAEESLLRGGKYYRPFISLAVYDALTGSPCTGENGEEQAKKLPDWVKQAAAAIEIFHKASLIHDDIEDDDPFRYGLPTLHHSHGIPQAINVGDYLLGQGYQTIANLRDKIPKTTQVSPDEIVATLIVILSKTHVQLCQGQGAELAWRTRNLKNLTPSEALKIYALKTSPAFQAALEIGVILAIASGEIDWNFLRNTEKILARFSKHLGVAFQIKNDLDDWEPNADNKRIAGGDLRHQRPTLIRALAGSLLEEQFRQSNTAQKSREQTQLQTFKRLHEAGVIDKARKLIHLHTAKARNIVSEIPHTPLKNFLYHFVETIAE